MNYRLTPLSQLGTNSIKNYLVSPPQVQRQTRHSKRNSTGIIDLSEDIALEPSKPCTTSAREQDDEFIPTVTTTSDSGSESSESDVAPPRKAIRNNRGTLEESSDDESDDLVSGITDPQKSFLRHLIDRLLREYDEDSEHFATPVDAIAEDIPTYHTVIERAMDLRTLRENLDTEVYSAVEDFEADFNLIIENSIRFNGLRHKVSQAGLRLLSVFNASMASLPGRH